MQSQLIRHLEHCNNCEVQWNEATVLEKETELYKGLVLKSSHIV